MSYDNYVFFAVIFIGFIYGFSSKAWKQVKDFEGSYEELNQEIKDKINNKLLLFCLAQTSYWSILAPWICGSNLEVSFKIVINLLFFLLAYNSEKYYFLYKSMTKRQYYALKIFCILTVLMQCVI